MSEATTSTSADAPSALLRATAWACLLLMLAVVASSAWLRLAQPRAACVDWPGCRTAAYQPVRSAAAAGTPRLEAAVRALHRTTATLALLASLALVALTLVRRPRRPEPGALALMLVALALGLSVLGIVTPGARSAAVLLGNLLGGMLMLALAWRLVLRLQAAPAFPCGRLHVLTLVAVPVWLLQAALGALSGAGLLHAAPVAHLALALVALPLAACTGWWSHACGRRREGAALVGLAALQALLGAATAASAAAPALTLLHNLGGAVGLALLVGLAPGLPADPDRRT